MRGSLNQADDGCHRPGRDPSWSESWYLDFSDGAAGVHGWLRLGCRVNEKRAEVSVCVHLPDGRVAVAFDRPVIDGNGLAAGGLLWTICEPFVTACVQFDGDVVVLPSASSLADPGPALRENPKASCRLSLAVAGGGLDSVLGADQADVARIFLPGQADGHHQQLVTVSGTVEIDGHRWSLEARGARDHSWGPRHWHAKRWFRWLTGAADDGFGFMLTRSASATEQRAGGFVWCGGTYLRIDALEVWTAPSVGARFTSGDRSWEVMGEALAWLPLRNRQGDAVLHIAKSPVRWTLDDGRPAVGAAELHDLAE